MNSDPEIHAFRVLPNLCTKCQKDGMFEFILSHDIFKEEALENPETLVHQLIFGTITRAKLMKGLNAESRRTVVEDTLSLEGLWVGFKVALESVVSGMVVFRDGKWHLVGHTKNTLHCEEEPMKW